MPRLIHSWSCDLADPQVVRWLVFATRIAGTRGELVADVPAGARTASFDLEEGQHEIRVLWMRADGTIQRWQDAAVWSGQVTGRQVVPDALENVAIAHVEPSLNTRVTVDPRGRDAPPAFLQVVKGPSVSRGQLVGEVPLLRQGPLQPDGSRLASGTMPTEGFGATAKSVHVRALGHTGLPGPAITRSIVSPTADEFYAISIASVSGATHTGFPAATGADGHEYDATDGLRLREFPDDWTAYDDDWTALWLAAPVGAHYVCEAKVETNEIDLGANLVFRLSIDSEIQRKSDAGAFAGRSFTLLRFPTFPADEEALRTLPRDPRWLMRECSIDGTPRQPLRDFRWEYIVSDTPAFSHGDSDYKPYVSGDWLKGRYVRVRLVAVEPTGWHQFIAPSITIKAHVRNRTTVSTGSPESAVQGVPGDRFVRTDAEPYLYVKVSGLGTTGWQSMLTTSSVSTAVILAPTTATRNLIQSPTAAVIPIRIRLRAAGETADLTTWEDDTGAAQARVTAAGDVFLGDTSRLPLLQFANRGGTLTDGWIKFTDHGDVVDDGILIGSSVEHVRVFSRGIRFGSLIEKWFRGTATGDYRLFQFPGGSGDWFCNFIGGIAGGPFMRLLGSDAAASPYRGNCHFVIPVAGDDYGFSMGFHGSLDERCLAIDIRKAGGTRADRISDMDGGVWMRSAIDDAVDAQVAWVLASFNTLTQPNSRLLDCQNGTTRKFSVRQDGAISMLGGISVTDTSYAGSPEGNVTAPVGSVCRDTSNGDLYVKETGTGNTGWKRLGRAEEIVTDHGTLGGLGDDDHPQYQLRSEQSTTGGYPALDGSAKVIEDPASATTTPGAGKIPIGDTSGSLKDWVAPTAVGPFLLASPAANSAGQTVGYGAGGLALDFICIAIGQLVGISAHFSGGLSAGTATIKAVKNGSADGTLTHTQTSAGGYTTGAGMNVSAGDRVRVNLDTDVAFNGSGTLAVTLHFRSER